MDRTNDHRPQPRIARKLASIAAALALGMTGLASAQPSGPPHGAGGPDGMLGQMLQSAKVRLNLDTSQQQAWDNAIAQAKSARQQAVANRQRVHDTLQAELAKSEPDLAAVAAASDQVQQQNQALHKAVRDQWLALYGMLSPDQKAIVRDGIAQRLARMETFRGQMRQRFHGPGGNG